MFRSNISLTIIITACTIFHFSCRSSYDYDTILRNGTVYDGISETGRIADIAIKDDRIVLIGQLDTLSAKNDFDVKGLAVAPGFINMLSWAGTSLIQDGRSLSDIHQGVTLEVLGEGRSAGPLNEQMKKTLKERQDEIIFDIEWTTLGEYLAFMEEKGISPNIASFVGATTLRIHEIGYDDREATNDELARMCHLAAEAMEEGAVGVSSALIYTPAYFANTDELIALAKVASGYGGMYISHIRSEGDDLLDALDEFTQIVENANIRGEIYHLKASGQKNWPKMDKVIEHINKKRSQGLSITANMYNYPASSTGLTVLLPTWVREGNHDKMISRLKDPKLRQKIISEMTFAGAGSPDKIMLVGFRNKALRKFIGKNLEEISQIKGIPPKEAAIDLIVEDDSRIGTVYFSMSEENMRKKVCEPWMSFCSDAGSMAPEQPFINRSTHPRAYGSFARLFAKFVREENLLKLSEAIRRLTSLPAKNLGLKKRGQLREGFFADIVVFDPRKIQDHATFDRPHQLATGMKHVFVNGVQVLKDGTHTGEMPGRFVKGPGWKPHK
jgi:N-acyl-D-amino-acid deacylase